MPDHHISDVKHQLTDRYERLAESRKLGLPIAVSRRFFEIGGLDMGGLLALELFTTIIPLILIGWSYASKFSSTATFGDQLIEQWGLSGKSAEVMRVAFGSGADLRSTWTVFGLAGFLVWGIPMSMLVAKLFALAWRRERFSWYVEAGRGVVWFALFLATMAASKSVDPGRMHAQLHLVPAKFLSFVPTFAFWSITPAILVRDGGRGARYLLLCGLVGTIIDAMVLRISSRIFLPMLLSGWTPFGPIGVAMTLMTWCGVIAAFWIVTACMGAVIWERRAPTELVVESQTLAVAAQPTSAR